jgi:hypothetical protein
MSRKRSISSIVGVVAVALVLAGCSLLPGSTSTPKATAGATPLTGQCWNASTKQADEWADWKGTTTVPCTASHTLYTYDVGKISGESGSSWATTSDPSSPTAEIQTKAEDACSVSTLLPHLGWNQQLINDYFFVPTESQWKAGARWVRCDIGVLATGTTLDNESFTALPSEISTLESQVSSEPQKFAAHDPRRVPGRGRGAVPRPGDVERGVVEALPSTGEERQRDLDRLPAHQGGMGIRRSRDRLLDRREIDRHRQRRHGVAVRLAPCRVLVGELPDVAARIPKTRRTDAPWTIDGTIQQGDTASGELGSGLIHVVDIDGELNA